MEHRTNTTQPPKSLRERAEEMLATSHTDVSGMSGDDVQKLVHELQVHQMELEIQNENLREAQVELAHSRDRYSDLYEFAPVGYLSLHRQGEITEANLTAATLLGEERQRLVTRKLTDFLPDEAKEAWHLHRRAVFAGDKKKTCELPLRRADGQLLTIRLESQAFAAEDGKVNQCRTAMIDVTTERQAQQRLAASEQRYRRLTDAVIDYVFTVCIGNDGAAETIHGPNCEAITGYTPDEFEANNLLWIAIVPEEDRPGVEHHVRQTLAGEETAPLEHRIRRKDGEVRWILRVTSPCLGENSRLMAYDGLLRDITAQKEAAIALRELNLDLDRSLTDRTAELKKSIEQIKLFGDAIACLGEGVVITSDHLAWPGPQIVFVNEAMSRITGYPADELIGQTPRILQGEDTDRETLDWLKSELSAGRPVVGELINYRKDGAAYNAELSITPLFDPAGHRTHFVSIHRDITEPKRVHEELRQSKRLLAEAEQLSHTGAWEWDQRCDRWTFSDEWRSIHGCGKSVLTTADLLSIAHPEDRPAIERAIARARDEGQAYEIEHRIRRVDTGEERFIRAHGEVVRDDAGVVVRVVGMAQDITEQKRAEEALAEFFAQAPAGLLVVDSAGNITHANTAAAELFGVTEPPVGRAVAGLYAEPERITELLSRLATGRSVSTHRARIGRAENTRHVLIDANARLEDGRLSASRWFLRDITTRVELEREVLAIGDRERERFAHDLHDDLCQRLTGCEFMTSTLAADLDGLSAESASQVRRIGALIAETIDLGRQLAHGLSPLLDGKAGLSDSLRQLAAATSRIYRANCTYHGPKTVNLPDRTVALHLYRIAQEAVGNAAKHGRASDIEIHLSRSRGQVKLLVRDNGVGLPANVNPANSFGLRVMRHRAVTIDGEFSARRRDEGGTEIFCSVKLNPTSQSRS